MTIFVIVALVLVVIIAVFFFSSRLSSTSDSHGSVRESSVHADVQACLSEMHKDGVYFVFLQGGYYAVPDPKLEYFPIEVPYYWHDNTSFFPRIVDVSHQLSLFIEDNVARCFSQEVIPKHIDVAFLDETVYIRYDIPISYDVGGSSFTLDTYEEYMNVRFIETYAFITKLLAEQENRKNYFPLSTLTHGASDAGFYYEILEIDKNRKIVSIALESLDERGPVVYNFGFDYGSE